MKFEENQITLFSKNILKFAPCSKDFTKSEVYRHLDDSEILEYDKHFEDIYLKLIQDGLLEQVPDRPSSFIRMTKKGINKKFSGFNPEEYTINRIIEELYNSRNKKKFYNEILDENVETFDYYSGTDMSRLFLHEGLIIWQEESQVWQLSPKGRRIAREGGWIEHNKIKKIKNEREQNLKYYQYADAKFRYYAFWPVFIFALIGGIYSTVKIAEYSTSQPKKVVPSDSIKFYTPKTISKKIDSVKYKINSTTGNTR